jgi:ADP-ribosylglycohydrolase
MFGAIYGDVIGSYYEVHCTKDYNFVFNQDSSFTDDSVLIAAVCKAIIDDPSDITAFRVNARVKEYAALYRQYYAYYPHAGF